MLKLTYLKYTHYTTCDCEDHYVIYNRAEFRCIHQLPTTVLIQIMWWDTSAAIGLLEGDWENGCKMSSNANFLKHNTRSGCRGNPYGGRGGWRILSWPRRKEGMAGTVGLVLLPYLHHPPSQYLPLCNILYFLVYKSHFLFFSFMRLIQWCDY